MAKKRLVLKKTVDEIYDFAVARGAKRERDRIRRILRNAQKVWLGSSVDAGKIIGHMLVDIQRKHR